MPQRKNNFLKDKKNLAIILLVLVVLRLGWEFYEEHERSRVLKEGYAMLIDCTSNELDKELVKPSKINDCVAESLSYKIDNYNYEPSFLANLVKKFTE